MPTGKWNVTVYVKATSQVLKNIQKVNYLAHSGFRDHSGPYWIEIPNLLGGTLNENKTKTPFSLGLEVSGGPKINAVVFFHN
jgi:hypothetical protein